MHPHVAQFLEFLRFPSISTDANYDKHVADCANWLAEKLRHIGLDATVHATAGHPIIVAKNVHRAGCPTVLIYGHYDVQPADPIELWTTPPFEPRIENEIVYARGATDNKGQIFSHI